MPRYHDTVQPLELGLRVSIHCFLVPAPVITGDNARSSGAFVELP